MDKKHTGSYYTPSFLANFISKRVLTHFDKKTCITVLEPSVGDGAFLEVLAQYGNIDIKLTALDINVEELSKASFKWTKQDASFEKQDFLDFKNTQKYSAIIGNPPYIKKNRLSEKQISLCKEIHAEAKLTDASVKNIWTTFLVKANTLLVNNGILAFVLPSELLQVKFAEEIREYLKKEFQRIEIFTFNDLMFECKGQDTIVLFAYKESSEKGEFFTNISSQKILEQNKYVLRKNNLLVDSKVKWTHHFLDTEELTFLDKLKSKLKTINYYAESKPGIVTAANNFFIIDKETEIKRKLSKFTIPIIQKGLYVNGSVVFNESDFNELEKSNHPSRLLQISNSDKITKELKEYLSIGEELEIPLRYKCRIRDNWYIIPNISKMPEAFFFKRSHLYPKLLKNNSTAFVTDSAYKVEIKNNFDLNSFIYSFYNTLTLIFTEIEGRYYGGGVLELTPSEFKKLPLPYTVINQEKFEIFTCDFKNKNKIEEILTLNDYKILNPVLGINQEDLDKLAKIRDKLLKKRLRS